MTEEAEGTPIVGTGSGLVNRTARFDSVVRLVKKAIEINYTILVDEDEVEKITDEVLDRLDELCACTRGGECNLLGGVTKSIDYDRWRAELDAEMAEYESKKKKRRKPV